ncbi:hypothetical protein GBAR_LOCUS5409 [Geodia barretti]|uniref:Uncharacterized protein n=1 Tax=Geodia barretti TaxID=519541 RepID=A0AA35W8C9_GEOBA|nr:hypothetical protein GBAR_LOCUS5409 [Geodia barretti]
MHYLMAGNTIAVPLEAVVDAFHELIDSDLQARLFAHLAQSSLFARLTVLRSTLRQPPDDMSRLSVEATNDDFQITSAIPRYNSPHRLHFNQSREAVKGTKA